MVSKQIKYDQRTLEKKELIMTKEGAKVCIFNSRMVESIPKRWRTCIFIIWTTGTRRRETGLLNAKKIVEEWLQEFSDSNILLGRVHCVKTVRIRSFSGPYSVRMRKIRTRKTPNTDTFHAAVGIRKTIYCLNLKTSTSFKMKKNNERKAKGTCNWIKQKIVFAIHHFTRDTQNFYSKSS